MLHLNLITVTDEAQLDDPTMIAAAQAVLAQAGLRLQVDRRLVLRGTPWSDIDRVTEPWEAPRGPAAQLCGHGASLLRNGALNVFIVDRLPPGFEGFSLGAPGPYGAIATDCRGAFLRRDAQGRVLAHELAHFLGLPHVRTITSDGVTHDDAIPDTQPGNDNLMEHGTRLTPGQVSVLLLSPLLRRD